MTPPRDIGSLARRDRHRRADFDVLAFDGCGLFTRVIYGVYYLVAWLPPLRRLVSAWNRWDSRHFESMNLFVLARASKSAS